MSAHLTSYITLENTQVDLAQKRLQLMICKCWRDPYHSLIPPPPTGCSLLHDATPFAGHCWRPPELYPKMTTGFHENNDCHGFPWKWGHFIRDTSSHPHLSTPASHSGWDTLRYTEVHWGYTGVHWGILRYTEVQWGTLGYTGVHWVTLRYTGVQWGTLRYTGVHWGTLRYTGLPWGTLGYFEVHWASLLHTFLRQYTVRLHCSTCTLQWMKGAVIGRTERRGSLVVFSGKAFILKSSQKHKFYPEIKVILANKTKRGFA